MRRHWRTASVVVLAAGLSIGAALGGASIPPQAAGALFAGEYVSAPLSLVAAIPPISRARHDAHDHFQGIRLRTAQVAAWLTDKHVPSASVVFYPFSGPDVAFPLSLFPAAHTYVLVSQESPSNSGGGNPLTLKNAITMPRRIASMLSMPADVGYFSSPVLEHSSSAGNFPGVLALSLATIVAYGADRVAVEPICLDSSGTFRSTGNACGFKLDFVTHGVAHRLAYIQLGLDDVTLGVHQGLSALLARDPYIVYCKSAEYKFQDPAFSTVRSWALAAVAIVQDDSCVPLRTFNTGEWSLSFFGRYRRALPTFDRYFQPDLAAIYSDSRRIGAAPQIGGYNDDFNQIVAVRKPRGGVH